MKYPLFMRTWVNYLKTLFNLWKYMFIIKGPESEKSTTDQRNLVMSVPRKLAKKAKPAPKAKLAPKSKKEATVKLVQRQAKNWAWEMYSGKNLIASAWGYNSKAGAKRAFLRTAEVLKAGSWGWAVEEKPAKKAPAKAKKKAPAKAKKKAPAKKKAAPKKRAPTKKK